jgi:uncharacterized protein YggU (UPF0235/DUF167 family)
MKIVVYIKPNQMTQFVEYIVDNLYGLNEYDVSLVNLPIEGKCNIELIGVLSDHFHISKSLVRIVGGHKSRCKIVEILH